MNKKIEIIKDLSNALACPAHEERVIEVAKKHLDKSLILKTDNMLNTEIYSDKFDETKPYIVFDAHMDEVGLMVQSFKANGHISVVTLGGWDLRNLLSQRFKIINNKNEEILAVVASVPPHFASGDAKLSEKDIMLDVGASSIEEIKDLGIEIGQVCVPDSEFVHDEKRGIVFGKAFDDRMGCAVLINTMNKAMEKGYHQVKGILSVQEEVGLRGAEVLKDRIAPDFIIALEGTPADDTLVPLEEAQAILGKGVQVRLMDRSAIMNPKFVAWVKKVADDNKASYQMAVRRGGGTNAGKYHLSRHATSITVLGVPVRYIHSHTGVAKVSDMLSSMDLCEHIMDAKFKK